MHRYWFVLVILLMNLAACALPTPQVSTPVPTATAISSDLAVAPMPLPSATATVALSIPLSQTVTPIATHNKILPIGISADGKWGAYWRFTLGEFYSSTADDPDGHLAFYNLATGATCEGPPTAKTAHDQFAYRLAWDEGDRFLLVQDGVLYRGTACQPELKTVSALADYSVQAMRFFDRPASVETLMSSGLYRPSRLYLLAVRQGDTESRLMYDPLTQRVTPLVFDFKPSWETLALSPDARHLAVSTAAESEVITAIVNLETGAVVAQINFPLAFAGFYGTEPNTPSWLTNEKVLMTTPSEEGPMTLTVGGEVEYLMDTLFAEVFAVMLNCETRACGHFLWGRAQRFPATGNYIISLSVDFDPAQDLSFLYDAEQQTFTQYDSDKVMNFAPNGAYALMALPDVPDATFPDAYLIRATNAPTASAIPLITFTNREGYPMYNWAPTSDAVAVWYKGQWHVFDPATAELVTIADSGADNFNGTVEWSPEGRTLVATTTNQAGTEDNLYLIRVK